MTVFLLMLIPPWFYPFISSRTYSEQSFWNLHTTTRQNHNTTQWTLCATTTTANKKNNKLRLTSTKTKTTNPLPKFSTHHPKFLSIDYTKISHTRETSTTPRKVKTNQAKNTLQEKKTKIPKQHISKNTKQYKTEQNENEKKNNQNKKTTQNKKNAATKTQQNANNSKVPMSVASSGPKLWSSCSAAVRRGSSGSSGSHLRSTEVTSSVGEWLGSKKNRKAPR